VIVSGFVETLRLKEMAEEDIYFARRDRELIAALRRRRAERAAAEKTETPPPRGEPREPAD
jgi:hypothetical protein